MDGPGIRQRLAGSAEIRRVAASFFIAAALSGCIEAFSWALLAAQKNDLLIRALQNDPLFPWCSLLAVLGLVYAAWRSDPGIEVSPGLGDHGLCTGVGTSRAT